jgi:hypothetical protein
MLEKWMWASNPPHAHLPSSGSILSGCGHLFLRAISHHRKGFQKDCGKDFDQREQPRGRKDGGWIANRGGRSGSEL